MTRTQRILTVVLAIQLVLLAALYLGSRETDRGEARPLLPGLEELEPTRIRISSGDEETIELEREGERWVLKDPAGYPTAEGKVQALLDKLEGLSIHRPVVSSNRYHDALEVSLENHQRRLRIWDGDGDDPRIDLFVGTSPNFDISHVRLGGDDHVYEVRGLGTFDLRADRAAWVERKFIDIPVDEVLSLKLRNVHGEIELARDDGSWALVSPTDVDADPGKLDAYAGSVCSMFLSAPGGRADEATLGLDAPAAELEITRRGDDDGADPSTLRVVVGAGVPGSEGDRYASRSGFDFGVILSRYDAEKLTEKKAADLTPDAE
jgi:hypothetical protein